MTKTGIACAAALLLVLSGADAGAGQATRLVPGARVRVAAPPGVPQRSTARIVAVSADTLILADLGGVPRQSVPLVSIASLEVSRGRTALRDAGIGFLAGAAIGAVIGAASSRPEDFLGQGAGAVLGATLFGATGVVVGVIVGSSHERWQRVNPSQIGMDMAAPREAGFAVSLSVRL